MYTILLELGKRKQILHEQRLLYVAPGLKSFHQVVAAAAAVQQHMKEACYEMGKLSAHPVLHENPGACSHPVSNSFCPERTAQWRGCQRESERDTTFKN